MHNPESIPKNETHKSHWDFHIQTDHLLLVRRAEREIVKKKKIKNKKKIKRTYSKEDFAVQAHHGVKLKESEERDRCLDLA